MLTDHVPLRLITGCMPMWLNQPNNNIFWVGHGTQRTPCRCFFIFYFFFIFISLSFSCFIEFFCVVCFYVYIVIWVELPEINLTNDDDDDDDDDEQTEFTCMLTRDKDEKKRQYITASTTKLPCRLLSHYRRSHIPVSKS